MKRIITSAVVILLTTAAVQAQSDTTSRPHHEKHQMQPDGAYKQLNLTADQKAKLKTLREDFKQKHEALNNQKLTEAERKTQMQALRQQQKAAMDAILTPAQKDQLTKLRNERKESMGNGKSWRSDSTHAMGRQNWQGRNGKGGPDLQKELNLTTEQQAKLQALRSDFRTKAEALRNDNSLSQDEKRTKMHALMQQQQEQMKTVLTKEQQEKRDSLRKERRAQNSK